MDFGYFKLLVALVFAEGVWSFPLGCQDNGTSYQEGEVVRAGEPCLSCVCRRGALACSLRVCADYVDALPPGCFLVHTPNDCCPRLFCEGGFVPSGIELRTAVKAENKAGENGCLVNGTVYGEGSAVASWDPCEYCYCTEGGIRCVKPRCVQSFEGCKAVYEKFSCCPTHFDCRDAKIGFLTSRVKHFGPDSKPEQGDTKGGESEESSTPRQEKTAEDLAATTSEEVSTEESTPCDQPESTTPPSPDYLTTLRLQTTEAVNSGEESSAIGSTEDTTPAVTTHELPRTEEGGSEASGAGSGNPVDVAEAVESRWNSSELAEDYDAYDYGEPKLPPSLPNLVIFPFVAADAVVKDDRAELYEEIQVERTDDPEMLFKDYFSPPRRTEGGFVPKQPSPEPFYEFPFLREELTEPPTAESPQMKAPPPTAKEASSSFDDDGQGMDLASEDILGDHLRSSPVRSEPFSQVLEAGMAELLLEGNSGTFRKSQQAKKPVTVAYKNAVVDFYPDYSVTTTRSDSTKRCETCLNATDVSHQFHATNPTTPASLNMVPGTVIGFSYGGTTLVPPKAAQELPAVERKPSVMGETPPTSVPKQPFWFDQFLKSLTESNTPGMISLTTSNKHKYSSKIKGQISTTAKPKRENGAESSQVEISHSASYPFLVTRSEGPSAIFHSIGRPQDPKQGPGQALTTPPVPSEREETANLGGHHTEPGLQDGPDRSSPSIHPNPGTLLKLAGCNIYGMMYRIGKVITELSGPCVECLCTDLGVQCRPLEC